MPDSIPYSSKPPADCRRNIELKARLRDFAAARIIAQRLATAPLEIQVQTDTYFFATRGRLKLREIVFPERADSDRAELVWYARPDQPGPKGSDYRLTPVPNPDSLKQSLAAAWGIWQVVQKRREIWLHHNVRIHLDQVAGLGDFLEFEAVLSSTIGDAQGQAQLQMLRQEFGLLEGDFISNSYSDLLAAQT